MRAPSPRRSQTWPRRKSSFKPGDGERMRRVSSPAVPHPGTTRVEVSVFQFRDEQAAAEALPYFLDARAVALGLSEAASPPAQADEARAIAGPVGEDLEATIYIRRGRDLFRVTAIGSGNPMRDVAALVN